MESADAQAGGAAARGRQDDGPVGIIAPAGVILHQQGHFAPQLFLRELPESHVFLGIIQQEFQQLRVVGRIGQQHVGELIRLVPDLQEAAVPFAQLLQPGQGFLPAPAAGRLQRRLRKRGHGHRVGSGLRLGGGFRCGLRRRFRRGLGCGLRRRRLRGLCRGRLGGRLRGGRRRLRRGYVQTVEDIPSTGQYAQDQQHQGQQAQGMIAALSAASPLILSLHG